METFEAEKAAFKTEKDSFEAHKQQFLDEKRRTEEANHAYSMALKVREDELQRETAKMQALNSDLERKINEMNMRRIPGAPMQPFYAQAQMQAQMPMQSQPAQQSPIGTPDELYRRAERDGIRLNTRSNSPMRSTSVNSPVKAQSEPPTYYNKGAVLFKSSLMTLAFLLIECLIVFFMAEGLNISFVYPLVPASIGLVTFVVCALLYANGYQANAKLNKKSPSYIFSATVLFVIGVIIAAMVAVYCKAPLFEPSNLLVYIIIPTVLLTNIILFPTFFHFFSISKKNMENDMIE
jgi:hypothetical protein